MPNHRPAFSKKMTVRSFENHYWYKDELVQLCKQHRLPTYGTKAELQTRLKNWLMGEQISDERQKNATVRKKQLSTQPITLEMRLIPDGFKFNAQARAFFADYYKVKKFSFTKEMAAAVRDAEKHGNFEMTVADLIQVYDEATKNTSNKSDHCHRQHRSAEEKTYQWNQFVKDFNADERTRGMKNRMQVAAHLWKRVRDRPGSKQYSPDLLDELSGNPDPS